MDDVMEKDPILGDIESFLTATGIAVSAFGKLALGDPLLVYQLRKGRELRIRTRARVRDFINSYQRDAVA